MPKPKKRGLRLDGYSQAAVFLLVLAVSGCGLLPVDPSRQADLYAGTHGFSKKFLAGGQFNLLSYRRISYGSPDLVVHLEGDGAAWRSHASLSSDPTPRDQLVLHLAGLDPTPSVIYLARPCQFVIRAGKDRGCESDYWSTARFAGEVVAALDGALTEAKKSAGAQNLDLIGYSGGAALAVLVAARRDDIASLRTIAGNLDHQRFTADHRVSPLTDSLNPVDVAAVVEKIPQLHFIGAEDEIVPADIAESFRARQSVDSCADLILVEGADHHRGWLEAWPELLKRPLPCTSSSGP